MERLAALHIENEALKGDPIADWAVIRQMTPADLCGLFDWHHVSYFAWVEEAHLQNHPSIITPLYIPVHRERTAKIDVPTIARSKRIRKKQAVHAEKMAAKVGKAFSTHKVPETWSELPRSRPKKKIQSRGFQGSRGFDGSIRWRDQRRKGK